MRAMLLEAIGAPLAEAEVPEPEPGPGELLLRVRACGVCRTDLHILAGELSPPRLPLILGHQVVGEVIRAGAGVEVFEPGMRVGVPWLGWSCGACGYCENGRENLCDRAELTGYHRDGGFAEICAADHRYCFPIPDGISDAHAAPLLCAGLIGHRALRFAGDAERLGLYGFGASAHIVIQVARHEGRRVYAFTRRGDARGQAFALSLGAEWAGGSDEPPPEPLDAAILFAPVGALVPAALGAVRKGGVVVCAGIHMSDIPSFPYALIRGERVLRSVANLTRADGEALLGLATEIPLVTEVTRFSLTEANDAIASLREGRIEGALVLEITSPLTGGGLGSV